MSKDRASSYRVCEAVLWGVGDGRRPRRRWSHINVIRIASRIVILWDIGVTVSCTAMDLKNSQQREQSD